jgi:hypothetical protein
MIALRVVGLVVFAVGLALIMMGLNAAHGVGTHFSDALVGIHPNRAIYLVVAGAAATVIGTTIILSAPQQRK